ncbi:hypothetical protein NUW58_g6912 [Xylaria curta]|uniref:Uncharacterized protein n=1 Tax=Xylaria curta TaxID=42375 RepID=A0ACC1NMQ8_9PEZI|nr:hypothetical protein NUW58_g6912 [Xylaria curta]
MAKYGLMNSGQIAAVIALTALESVEYVYKHNVSPGRPGQGTSNMQMFSFNLQYAKSIPELKDALAGISGINEQNPDSTPDDAKKAVLALVQDDKYNFGSGPWYLSTMPQCDAAKKLLETSPDAGWAKYMTDCVGVDAGDAKRNEYWARAKKAFGLS